MLLLLFALFMYVRTEEELEDDLTAVMMMMKIQIGTDIARQTTRALVSSVEMVI